MAHAGNGGQPKKGRAPKKASPTKEPDRDAGGTPRPYPEWRTGSGRAEDAAHSFGYYLMAHCREEALKKIPAAGSVTRAEVEEAVDIALHNVLDLIEGFWPLPVGPKHRMDLELLVNVRDENRTLVESQRIDGLDLPIGYWIWAREGSFR